MSTLLLFFVPPVIGAFIGYITNSIAIKMLFRPLKEVRIFGIRVPFTPGILPRQRNRLAQSIGAMVERELITPEIIRNRLLNEELREKSRVAIISLTEKVFEKTPNDLLHDHKKLLLDKVNGAAEKLFPAVTSSVMDFLEGTEIRKEMESRGRILLMNIFLKLNSFQRFFLSAGQYDKTLEEKMPEIISDLITNVGNLLNDSKIKNKLLDAVTSSFDKFTDEREKTLKALIDIGEGEKSKLDNFIFDKLVSAVDGQIENILSSINIKTVVSERIDSLDMIRVERIVLDVMSDQFKWINIFGGILGFLIGLFQSVFARFVN